MGEAFRLYLDQDEVWPVPGGVVRIEEMSPAHRLCALLSLERARVGDRPLLRRLREVVAQAR